MNLTIAPVFGKKRTPSVRRLSRVLAASFLLILFTTGSVLAGPVRFNQVAQTVSTLQGTTDFQLTLISQDPVNNGPVATNGPRNDRASVSSDPKLDVLLGFPLVVDNKIGVDVEVSEEGEVEGSICDCGEILIAGGGFPKWPLLFLTAVPLVFIDTDEDCTSCDQSTPTPTLSPTTFSTPTPTPEPASLLIFGTGLVAFGAGLRRRYTKSKLARQNETEEQS